MKIMNKDHFPESLNPSMNTSVLMTDSGAGKTNRGDRFSNKNTLIAAIA